MIDSRKATNEIVGEQILYSNGPFRRVRRWVKGKYPNLGRIIYGFTGWETEIEMDVIKPVRTFLVAEEVNEDKTSYHSNLACLVTQGIFL